MNDISQKSDKNISENKSVFHIENTKHLRFRWNKTT